MIIFQPLLCYAIMIHLIYFIRNVCFWGASAVNAYHSGNSQCRRNLKVHKSHSFFSPYLSQYSMVDYAQKPVCLLVHKGQGQRGSERARAAQTPGPWQWTWTQTLVGLSPASSQIYLHSRVIIASESTV